MTTFHQLKVWPEYMEPLIDGRKTFEVRKDDRQYRVGDVLCLREFNPGTGQSNPNREVSRRVVYLLRSDPQWGIADGFVVLGLGPV